MRHAVVGVVLLALFVDTLLLTAIVPIVPDLFPDATDLAVGLLFSSKALAQILVSPLVGALVDSAFGAQRCLALGLLVLAVSTSLFAFASSYPAALVARSVQGLASSLNMSGGMALVAEAHGPAERGAASGVAMSGLAGGVVVGPTVGGLLYGAFGKRTTFLSLSGLLGVNLIAQLLLWRAGHPSPDTSHSDLLIPLHDDDNQSLGIHSINSTEPSIDADAEAQNRFEKNNNGVKASRFATFRALMCDHQVVILLASGMLANTIISMLQPLVPAILKEDFGMDAEQRGFLWSVTPISYFLATPAAGFLSDRVCPWKIIAAALLMFGASLPFGAQFGPRLPLLLTVTGVAGAATAYVDTPAIPLLADIAERRKIAAYGTVFAIANSFAMLGFIVGPLLGEGLASLIAPQWTLVVFGVVALMFSPIPLLLSK